MTDVLMKLAFGFVIGLLLALLLGPLLWVVWDSLHHGVML
jgi:hypothetical protein